MIGVKPDQAVREHIIPTLDTVSNYKVAEILVMPKLLLFFPV